MRAAVTQNPAGRDHVIVFEIAVPKDSDESKKMNGNALLLIRSFDSSQEQVKISAAYVEEVDLSHQLTLIGKQRKKTSSPDGFQEDSLYFIPLRLLNPKDQLAVLLTNNGSIMEVGSPPLLEASTAAFLTGRESELSMSFRSGEWKKLANREFPGIDLSTKRSLEEIRAYLTKQVPPHYPEEARRQYVTGSVILRVLIDASGKVKGVYLVEGAPLLARAAAEAVRQWQFRPYAIKGHPAETESQIIINFEMGG